MSELFPGLQAAMKAADSNVEDWQKEVDPGDIVLVFSPPVVSFCEVLDVVGAEGCENYRQARVFSEYVPEGEIEDIHVSAVVQKIDEQMFTEAKGERWSPAVCIGWLEQGKLKRV